MGKKDREADSVEKERATGQENVVLCGANSYEQKYYFNRDFNRLPEEVKKELQIMCVLFTEDVGGVLMLEFTPEGSLEFKVQVDEGDQFFDEIGSGLKIRQYQREKKELFKGLEVFYQVFFLGMDGVLGEEGSRGEPPKEDRPGGGRAEERRTVGAELRKDEQAGGELSRSGQAGAGPQGDRQAGGELPRSGQAGAGLLGESEGRKS